ncbi:MAG: SpvB/TcaC N-terminal domain-containing protein, partial [Candidatus Paceibacterota bacterium]
MKNKFFSLAFLVLVSFFITSPFTIVIAQEADSTIPPISSDSTVQTSQTDQTKTEESSSATTGEVLGATTEAPVVDDSIIPPEEKLPAEEAISEEAKKEEEMILKGLTDTTQSLSEMANSSKNRLIPGIDNLTGALVYEYEINVPPGRNKMTPDLSLVYNSATATSDSIIGSGWSLNIPSIERINRKGSDKLYMENYYSSSLSGELIVLNSTDYVARTEIGDFLTYQKLTNGWLVTDKNGTQYTFGANAQARQDDFADTSKVFKWMLEEVRDANNNYISYEYYKDAGQIYPSKITYTGNGSTAGIFEINFERENHVNAPTFFNTGFAVQSNYRISEIRTEVSKVWVRKYILTYTTGNNNSGSLLNTITESGQDDSGVVTTLPANTFEYELSNQSGWTPSNDWILPSYIDGNGILRGITFGASRLLSDVNGDGLPDLVFATSDPITGNPANDTFHRVYLNTAKKLLLKKINLGLGGSSSFTYTNPRIQDASNSVPFPVFVVDSITTNDNNGNINTVNYQYRDAFYYFNNYLDRKLAGFGSITNTDSAGNVKKTYYHQGNTSNTSLGEYDDHVSKIGKAYRLEEYNNAGNLYRLTVDKWDKLNLGTNYDFVKLIRRTTLNYDGDNDHADTSSEYSYDSYGNITQETNWGKVNANNDGSFSDTGTDKSTENVSYVLNLTDYIVGLPYQDILVDQNSSKVREKKIYYDNLSLGSVGNGNMTKEENWITGTTYVNNQKTYNTTFGTVISEIDPRGKITLYTYDSYNLYPATITDPLLHNINYIYDYSIGKPKQVIDQNNFTYQTIFDGLDRVIEEKIPSLISPYSLITKTAFVYTDISGAMKIQRTDYLDSSISRDTYQYLDGLGRLIQERKEAEISGDFNVRDIVYNNVGLTLKESLPYTSSGSAKTSATGTSSLYTNYTYDALQRPLITTNALGSTSYAYDDWKTTITDAENNVKNYYKDARDNLIAVDEVNGGSIYTTNYEWNLNNKLTKITDALGNVRNFTFDGIGRRLTAQDLHAPSDTTFGSWIYVYDNASNLTQTTNPRSQIVNYTYDDINRTLTENYTTDLGTEISYSYDTCANGIGKLCSTTMTSGANTSFTYNSNGGIASETKNIGGTNYLTSYTYDRQGNILSIIYPDNAEIKYTYNSAGLLEKIERKESGGTFTDVISNFNYNPLDQITIQVYPNNVITTNTYDATKMYRLTRKQTLLNGGGGSTTLSFYPSAGDGYVYHNNASWDITHDATSGSYANYTSSLFYTGDGRPSSTTYRIYRSFLPFDTSSLPDGVTITDAKLKIKVSSKLNNDNDGDDWITVVQATQPSITNLMTADYDLAGNINNPTEGIDTIERKDITNITTNAYLTFNLNTMGKSWINTTGPTKLGLREGHDVIDSSFTGALGGKYNYVIARSSEYTGTANDPILEVTYNNGGSTLQDLNYTYDNVGNITKIIDSSNTNSAKTVDYVYDDLNRLTSAVATNTANNQNYTQNFTYDVLGNILTGPIGNYLYQGNTGTLKANPHPATSINGV